MFNKNNAVHINGKKYIAKDINAIDRRKGKQSIVFIIAFIILSIYALSLIIPFFWMITKSFQSIDEYLSDMANGKPFSLPKKIEWANYLNALTKMSYTYNGKTMSFFGMFFNSLWIVLIGAGLNVFFQAVCGYVFAKYAFRSKAVMLAIAIFCMTVPIIGTTGAQIKVLQFLNIMDDPMQIVITSCAGFGGNFLVMLAIFKNISWSYAEAVFIDGGGHYTVFFKIMLPQALPAMLTLFITALIGRWNDYMSIMIFLPSYPTLSSGMYMMESQLRYDGKTMYYAALLVSAVPILVLFAFFADSMMKNLSVGGLKG